MPRCAGEVGIVLHNAAVRAFRPMVTSRSSCSLALCALVLASCHVERVQAVPFAGPAPRSVVVAPLVDLQGDAPASLLAGADTALRDRGFRALPLDAGIDLLRSQAALRPDGSIDLRAVAQRLDVESVLLVEVEHFEADGARRLESARWKITWRLVAAPSGSELWRHEDRGTWQRPAGDAFDPTARPNDDPPVAMIGERLPADHATVAELAASLHLGAMARMPRGAAR